MDNPRSRDVTPDLYGGNGTLHHPVKLELPPLDEFAKDVVDVSPSLNGNHVEPSLVQHSVVPSPTESDGAIGVIQPKMTSQGQAKRKRSRDDLDQDSTASILFQESHGDADGPDTKRIKSDNGPIDLARYAKVDAEEKLHGLTVPLWQRIFTFLPPVPLARLLRVNKAFNILLNAPADGKPAQRTVGSRNIDPKESNRIWEQSNSLFARGLPLPFQGQKALPLWQLIKGKRCQHCGQVKPVATDSSSVSPFQAGPGRSFMRVIWPFQKRLCGDCLRSETRTDDDLTLSGSFPSFLKDALPAIYLTDSNDYVPASKYATFPPPPGLRLVKVYFRPQVEAIKRRYDHMKEFSSPAKTSQWVASLDDERAQIQADVDRWEQWEQKGNLARLNNRQGPPKARKPQLNGQGPDQSKIPAPFGQVPPADQVISPVAQGFSSGPWGGMPRPLVIPQHASVGGLSSPPGIQQRGPRNYQEIQAARAARRTEIERRASLLQPPITIQLLEHMESFRAALQISTVLDDSQWEFLKTRLEAERSDAERKVADQAKLAPGNQSDPRPSRIMEPLCEPPKQPTSTPDTASSPKEAKPEDEPKGEINIQDVDIDPNASNLHKRLAHFADQVTIGKWNGGRSLSRESSAQFAAEVLIQVRKNYYEKVYGGRNATDPSLPPLLTLENMKWVHENRVKPLTEQFQKDIFLCNGCENNTKGYGFEAVIQHYAAKHTSSLSLGSVVVHWKAEWPEKPPFHPNPMLVKALAITSSTSSREGPGQGQSEPQDAVTVPHSLPIAVQSQSPGSYYPGSMQFTNGPFAAPGYGQTPYPVPDHSSQSFSGPPPPPTALPGYPGAPSNVPNHSNTSGTFQSPTNISPYQATPAGVGMPYTMPPPSDQNLPTAETYRKHLAEMAKLARELWYTTAGVKGLQGTVRTQIIIHHACERFVNSFQLQPGVAMFLDGLNHEAAMRPLRSLNGFSCKSCATGQAGTLPPSERKQSTLPHLLGHFRTTHAENPGLDWRKDMVQLPQLSAISDLVNAPGMDESKFALLAAAFPGAFPYPLPSLVTLQRKPVPLFQSSTPKTTRVIPQGAYQTSALTSPSKTTGYSGIIPAAQAHERKASDSPGENEYDPRKPSYLGHFVSSHPGGNRAQTNHNNGYSSHSGITPHVDDAVKQEVGDADRFLADLKPHLEAGRMQASRHEHPRPSSYHPEQLPTSSSHSLENNAASTRNGHYPSAEEYYYRRPEGHVGHHHEALPERYVTRYYEPAARDEYPREAPVTYYIREANGRLVPAGDRAPQIIYEREPSSRERAFEYVTDIPRERYYAPEASSAPYRDEVSTYSYSTPREIVYLDRHVPHPHETVMPQDAGAQPMRDEYRREHIYRDENVYR